MNILVYVGLCSSTCKYLLLKLLCMKYTNIASLKDTAFEEN